MTDSSEGAGVAHDDVAGLRAEVSRLQGELRDAQRRLTAAEVAAAEFSVGEEVEARPRRVDTWQPAIVRSVDPHSWGAWYKVSFRRKDGTWSTAARLVFDEVRPVGGAQ